MQIQPLANTASAQQTAESTPRSGGVEEIAIQQDALTLSRAARAAAAQAMPIISETDMKMQMDHIFMEEVFQRDLETVNRWDLVGRPDLEAAKTYSENGGALNIAA
ncbi:hypothetical protein [Magnetofaba australis]|nr:hypothetical protein [Magnetofaba australis]